MRRLTSWHHSRLRAAYRRTGSVPQAAAAVGVAVPTAYRVLGSLVTSAVPVFKTSIRREAKRLYLSGLSCRAVARELAASNSPAPSQESVHQWMKAAGVLRSKSRSNVLMNGRLNGRDYDVLAAAVRRLAAEEMLSIHAIAARLDVSRNFVARHFPRAFAPGSHHEAMKRRYWQAYLPEVEERRRVRDEVITLRERGLTLTAIAEQVKRSPATVWRYLREAGMTKAQKGRAAA